MRIVLFINRLRSVSIEEGLPTIGNNVKIYAGAKNSRQGKDRRQCEYWREFCSAKGCPSQCHSAWGSRCYLQETSLTGSDLITGLLPFKLLFRSLSQTA